MRHLTMFLLSFSWTWLWSELPVKVIAVSGSLYALIQLLKQKLPGLQGNWAVLLNLVGSFAGIFAVMPKDQFFTVQTMAAVITAFVGAGGIHGIVKTVTGLSAPAQTANPALVSTASKIVSMLLLCALLCGGLTACNSFERTAFQSLSASQAVLNTAQSDYEPVPLGTGKLPHTQCVYALINDGKAAQVAGVTALQAYDVALNAKQSTVTEVAAVTADLATVAGDLAKVKALYTTPNCGS